MYKYFGKNIRPFTAICDCNFGRKVIYTRARKITKQNIVAELSKALPINNRNSIEIDYLDRYYRGDQPINYRKKVNRPEVNNKIAVNLAYELVERKTADICAEPIQYVLRGTDKAKSEEISKLNAIMDAENKQECDIDICRWRSICGTAYRFIGNDEGNGSLLDESDFELSSEDPRYTFVVYYSNNKPAFSCQIREDEDGKTIYFCYTNSEWFEIVDGEIRNSGINGNGAIPVIEYPNNSRRLSDIEMTIGITDAINTLSSDRINGIEQFVSSWVKFVNCEIDKDTFQSMRLEGALVVKSNNGSENKADVDVMTTELNQTEGQVVFTDLFERFLDIQGLANRESNTGGDTGSAVQLRNGHYDAGLRTAINEPIIKKSENASIKIILNRLRIKRDFKLLPSDVEIHINHNKLDNMLVKAEVMQILLNCGVHYKRAIKTVDMFSDPEQVALESQKRMDMLYPDKKEETEPEETIEVNEEVV
uniref:Portal protein n=1 Tax=Dulem virus 39 TaxID=3145757 RepID=A0AAU8B5C0_9CAUD